MAAPDPQMVPIDVLVAVIAVVQLLGQGLVQVLLHFVKGSNSQASADAEAKRQATLQEILEAIERGAESKDAETHMVRDLYDMHKVADKDGRPIWYFPGSVVELNREQLVLIRDISAGQRELAKLTESVVKQLERMDYRRGTR